MNCVLVRVDNRLVHGQIIEAWVPHLKIAQIIVVDDEVASDFFRETVIKMAVPSEMVVKIKSVEDFVREALGEAQGGARSIVLFSGSGMPCGPTLWASSSKRSISAIFTMMIVVKGFRPASY